MAGTAPRGLSRSTLAVWRKFTKIYELRPDELRILADACREMDLIDRMQEELETADLTTEGSMGQTVASPLVQEVRQHRAVLARLFSAIKLPDEPVEKAQRSTRARDAATARWQRGA